MGETLFVVRRDGKSEGLRASPADGTELSRDALEDEPVCLAASGVEVDASKLWEAGNKPDDVNAGAAVKPRGRLESSQN